MVPNEGKRNSRNEADATTCAGAGADGVGGRRSDRGALDGGGGYLDFCNGNEIDLKGSQLDELRALGLQRVWLSVAAVIGVDNFINMWRVLCAEVDMRGEMQRVYVPRFRTFIRYQRNRVILAMSAEGKDSKTIRDELRAIMGEVVTRTHIDRIIKHNKAVSNGCKPKQP